MINFLKRLICEFTWHKLKGDMGICKRCGKVIIPVR